MRMSKVTPLGSLGAGELRRELDGAGRSMRELESGSLRSMRAIESAASRAAVAVRNAQGGGSGGGQRAIESGITDMRQLSDGSWGTEEPRRSWAVAPPRALGPSRSRPSSSAGSPGAFSWAGVGVDDFSYAEGLSPRGPKAPRTGAARILADRGVGGAGSGGSKEPLGTGYNGVGAARILADRAAAAASGADRATGSLGQLARVGDDAGKTLDGAAGSAGSLAGRFNSLSAVAGNASGPLGALGLTAAYSAAGSGILTAAVGTLGTVGVASLGAVGVASGVAGTAMANFALDAHQDSAKFGGTLKQMGQQSHLAAQAISEPMAEAMVGLGRSMVGANNQMTPAGAAIVGSLQQGFGNAAGVINRSSGSIVDAAGVAASGFSRLTEEAAPAAEAFLGQLPSLTGGAVSAMSQVTSEFGRSGKAMEGATPSFNRMLGSLGGLGAELTHVGVGSMVAFNEGTRSMVSGLTAMTSDLEPAIKPSMQAFTDTINAGTGGIGSLAHDIAGFAGTLSANAPQLESVVGSLGRGMLSFGSAVVDGLGMAAPAIAGMADSIQANQGPIGDFIGGMVEGVSNAVEFGANVAGGISRANNLGSDLANATTPGGSPFSPGASIGDQARKAVGLGPSGIGGKPPSGSPGAGDGGAGGGGGPGFFSKGGGFDQISSTGGLVGAYGRAVSEKGGAKATPESDAAMSAASRASAPGAPPLATPSPTAAVMGAARTPVAAPPPPPSVASGTGADLIGAMSNIPSGVGAARSALNTLPAAASSAMGGAKSAIAGADVGASMGAQMNRTTKTVEGAAPSAAAAGGKVGGAIGGGMAKGTSSSITVTDEIIINHVAKVKETAMTAMNARSPSRDFEKIGRYAPQGFDLGVAKGFRAPPSKDVAAGISERGQAAMAASSQAFASQDAQNDSYRTSMQSMSVKVPGAAKAAASGLERGPGEALKGAEKRAAFGEDSSYKGTRMVFDKKVQSWQGTGEPIKVGSDGMWSGIQSPLDARQQTAMETMQNRLDQGVNRNYGMFGERTMQNIERGRPGAFAVVDSIKKKDAEQQTVSEKKTADTPVDITPGGSGAGGQSYLGRDRINMVRQAAGLGRDTMAGFGQGLNANQNMAVDPMGRVTKAQRKRYTDDWGISSPSTVAAGYSGDIMAGAGGGLLANADVPVGAMGRVSDAMQGVASDRGLQVGLTWGENVLTGADQVLKKADYQATGLPRLDSAAAMTALAGTGLLKAGSGASIVKTVGNTPSIVTLGGAGSGGEQSFTIRHQLDINGQVHEIATEVFLDNLGRVRDAVAVAAR